MLQLVGVNITVPLVLGEMGMLGRDEFAPVFVTSSV